MLVYSLAIPVLCDTENSLEAFNGLVLSIDLSLSETDIAPLNNRVTREPNKPMNFMILHRDLERLCSALAAGSTVYWSGFAENVALSITMAPMLHKLSNPALQAAFKTYFSDVTQSKILAPLRSSCSGYGRVSFDSLIDKKLAAVVLEDMSREKWSDPAVLSAAISKAKEQGSTLFHAGEITTGCRYWLDAIVKLHTTRLSRSWGDLVRKGGETFLNQVAEDFFFMSLNLAQAHLDLSQDPIDQSHLNTVVMPFLTFAAQSTRENFWSTGHTFRPSDKDLAELCYRRALCLRLTSHPGSAAEALEFIDIAFRLLPQDAAIVRERQAILQWSDQT